MYLFNSNKWQLKSISEARFALERDMQKLTESNLTSIFGLQFITTEFALSTFRIDTLAYDSENWSFVIIEYKRGTSRSVIDQWYSYLSLMLNNKAEFVQALSVKLNKILTNKDINREASKVIFIASSFNQYQKESINFKDLPIELRELKKYSNDIVAYNPIKAQNSTASVKTIEKKDKDLVMVNREIKTYTVDDHFTWTKAPQRDLYEWLRDRVLQLDSRFIENSQKSYIGFKIWTRNVLYLHVYVGRLHLSFSRTKPDDVNDPEKKLSYQKNSMKFYNQHVSGIPVHSLDDLDYITYLIKQVLKLHKY